MGVENRVKWTERENENEDPLEFFRENYDPRTTRGQLSRIDSALYKTFWRRRLLDDAIPKRESRFGNDVYGYYTTHYPGKTRSEISKLDRYLYEKLAREGLLERVPVKQEDKH